MKQDTIIASSKDEKSTVGCANNQRCLFNHSVIAHDVAEKGHYPKFVVLGINKFR